MDLNHLMMDLNHLMMDMMDLRARHYRGHLHLQDVERAMPWQEPCWFLRSVAGMRGLVTARLMPLVDLQQILKALGRGPQMTS